jgi:hypothetical protein
MDVILLFWGEGFGNTAVFWAYVIGRDSFVEYK